MRRKIDEYFCYCEGREREMGGGGRLECRLLLQDTAASVRGKKALMVEVTEGGREKGRESKERSVA